MELNKQSMVAAAVVGALTFTTVPTAANIQKMTQHS